MLGNHRPSVASVYEAVLVPADRRIRPLVLSSISAEYLGGQITDLRDVVAEVLPTRDGVVISFETFQNILMQIEDRRLWLRLSEWSLYFDRGRFVRAWHSAIERVREQLSWLAEPQRFGMVAIQDLVRPVGVRPTALLPQFVGHRGIWFAYPTRSVVLGGLYWFAVEEVGLDAEEFAAWIAVAERLIRPAPARIGEIVTEYLQYEVPYSLSPELRGHKIGELWDKVRDLIYFPLAGTAMGAGQAAMEGDWVLAMKVALGGGGAIVIFAAAVSLAEYLINFRRRGKRKRD